mgnify:FL=1
MINDIVARMKEKFKNERARMTTFGVFGFIGLVLAGTLGVSLYRVYAKVATDKFTVTVAKALR